MNLLDMLLVRGDENHRPNCQDTQDGSRDANHGQKERGSCAPGLRPREPETNFLDVSMDCQNTQDGSRDANHGQKERGSCAPSSGIFEPF